MVTTRIGDATHLHRMPEPKGKRIALTRGAEPVRNGAFQPGGEKLLYVADQGGDENYQLWLVDTADPKAAPVRLTDGKSRNTDATWSKDGKWIAYATNRRDVKASDIILVNAADPREERVLLRHDTPGWGIADWSDDGQRLLLRVANGQEDTRLWTADVATGAKVQVSPKTGRRVLAQARFGDGDQAVYALSDHEADFLDVVRLDLRSGELRRLGPAPRWDAEELALSSDGRRLAFTRNEEGWSVLHVLELPSGRELTLPAVPAGVLSTLAWRQGSHELGFSLNSEETAADAWSVDVDAGTTTRWTDRTSKPKKPIVVPAPRVVRTPGFDGLSIPALVYQPDPAKFPGKRPALFLLHGGPEGQSRPGYRGNLLYYLDELGVALIYPNVRGSTGYGRRYLGLDNVLKREDSVKDVGALLDWAAREERLDPTRFAVSGGSYGGYLSLACLTTFPERFRCGIDNVGIANFVTFLRDTSDYRRGNRRLEYGDERKPEVREFLERISPANHADRIRAPLLIFQGRNDPRVPVTEAERMRDAVRAKGGLVWYVMAKDEGHGFVKKANNDYQFLATALFLREFLLK
jgi:dipeptidyl aminopeptidase/acylaminoacyl peptidase